MRSVPKERNARERGTPTPLGAIIPIHCVIPGATDVDLQIGSNWVEAKGYEDPILKTEVMVDSKDVIIYAKYGQNTNYDGLFRYSVE